MLCFSNTVKKPNLLQKKSLRMMFFQSQNSHTDPFLKDSKFLKFFDKTTIKNYI